MVDDKDNTKLCAHCKKVRPLTQFYRSTVTSSGWSSWCRPCQQAYKSLPKNRKRDNKARRKRQSEWYKKNAGVHIRRTRNTELIRKFGIGLTDYARMCVEQDWKCALCEASDSGGRGSFPVDHDHKTMIVRGLLCNACNVQLGGYEALKERVGFEAVETYLQRGKLDAEQDTEAGQDNGGCGAQPKIRKEDGHIAKRGD